MRRATVLSFAMAICLPVATLGQSPDADQSIRPLLNYNTEELGNAEADLGAGIVDDDNAEFKDLLRQGPLASPTAPAPPVPESVDDQAVPSDDFAANLEAPSNTPVPMGLSSLGVTRDSYSAMPSMIGDTSAGGCGVVRFDGGIPIASVMHPTFACSRLNIAENNNAALRDRVYLSYRHFQDASSVSVFPGVPNGGQANQNIDRVTFGIERRLTDLMSIEVRVPVNHQLSSDLSFSQLTGPLVGGPPAAVEGTGLAIP